MEIAKIKEMLDLIKVDENGNWFVPNRKYFDSDKEFLEFEKMRISEFYDENIRNTKYKYHYNSCSSKFEKQLKICVFCEKKHSTNTALCHECQIKLKNENY